MQSICIRFSGIGTVDLSSVGDILYVLELVMMIGAIVE